MAAPHVAGVVALYLERHPGASPQQVHRALLEGSSQGLLAQLLMRPGTPNKLLYSRFMMEEGAAGGPAGAGGEQVVRSSERSAVG